MAQRFLWLSLALILAACSGLGRGSLSSPTAPSLTEVRLPMGYIPNVQFASFYVADAKGFYQQAGLKVTFEFNPETDAVALVGANQLPFAVVSGEQVLLARAQGLPVVYIMAWWHDYPVAVVALKEAGIRQPSDLKGRRIGLPGLYGASYVGLRALLSAAGLQEDEVRLDSIGFNQVEALVSRQVEAAVVYANNEPLQLAHRGYEVDVIRVADYVQLASNGLITNETLIAQNPDLVQRMVQATLRGIAYTLENPDEAFLICTQYVEGLAQGDQTIQRQVLEATLEFWRAKKLGYSDPRAWQNMQEVLLGMGMLSQPLDLNQVFTNQFVEK